MSEPNKSTGPRTPEGKAISSMNALKHGLNARDVVLKNDEEREEFAELLTDLAAELNPDGVLETLIFNRFLRASWDLRRVERLEVEQVAAGVDIPDDAYHVSLELLARYKMRAERSFYRAHREIQALQADRRDQAKAEAEAQAKEDEAVRSAGPWTLEWVTDEDKAKKTKSDLPGPPYTSDASPDDLDEPSAT